MKLSDSDSAYFLNLETSLHRRQIRNCADAASALLADGFIEFGASGKVWDKSSIIESMRRETLDRPITVEEFAARELTADIVLVTYVTKRSEKTARRKLTISTLRSSIWQRVDGRWQMIFHQGTRTPHRQFDDGCSENQ
jgi:hypothetical protein